MHAYVLNHSSGVWLFVTLWTVAHQVPLSMQFYKQEYFSGLLCPPPGDLPNPGIEPSSLMSQALTGRFFTTSTIWKAPLNMYMYQITNILWVIKKAREFRKTSTSALLTMPKPSTVWITANCGKFLKRWKYQTTWPASWEICMQVKKQQLELDMEQQTGSKLGKEYIKAVYCHPAYLTYMQSTSWEMLGWMQHKLESKISGKNINNLSYAGDTTLRKQRRTKEPLDESERGEWKSWLKAQHSEN